ncbi:SusD/RagB family nutrient-binding outer membrane lipoprotein [Neolewinella antarctica]|uniref:SusD/RagB family nutrient-binding outer membrane lipoprotein n=1 Tax=Neolewinella antarctica TaxID=442734 RepID=A0ABX0X9Z0_9BACT|nr:SusD/RagB family nutrient-binding outer membrane lipoprotein [Neolewinella antarctica]NJC26032.1 hypothetical protein [Neolewinella antarctica]
MNYSIAKVVALFTLLLCSVACSEDYLNVNDNPNFATRPPLDGLLANASTQTGLNQFRVADGHVTNFVQYIASPNISSDTDIYLDVASGGAWSSLYGTMTDLYDLIRFGREQEAEGHVGIAQVLMAINLGLVVDNWGDAPYSDAFTGTTIRPTYDSAEELYATIFTLLDEGEANLLAFDGTPGIRVGADFIYGTTNGDEVEPWLRAIASLRARYLNHLSETDAYDPVAVLAAVDTGFTSNTDNASLTIFEVRNPWAGVAIANAALFLGGWLSDQFVDALNGDTYGTFDPRLPLITDTTSFGDYRGTVNGAGRTGTGTDATETYLSASLGPADVNAPVIIMSYAELKFIEAEAAFRTSDQDRADAAFRSGIRASMDEYGVSAADRDAFITAAYGAEDDDVDLDDIFREKYTALFLNPETWVDARRYDYQYQDFDLAENAALSTFPVRLQYPNSELDRNRINAPTVTLLDPIFWDE